MATPVFQPPPTHTEVILKDAQSRWLFNPAWVKWFLELTQMINNSGGGSGTIQHNSTGGLQGGGTGEYYHLTNQEHGWVADTPVAPTAKFWRGDHTWTNTLAGPFQATDITGTGNLSIQGNTTLGDSTADTITFTGRMASTLLWGTDNTLDIGAVGANRPRDLYLGRDLFVGGTLTITGGIVITGDLTVNGNTTLGNSTTDTLTVASNAVTWSGNPTHSGNHVFSGNITVNGNVVVGDSTTDTFTVTPNTVTWTNNPTHSGNHTWSGNMTMNGNNILGNSTTDTLTIGPNAVTWSGNPTHSGNHVFSGDITINGNTVIGDSTTDTFTVAVNAVTWSGNPTHSGNHLWSGRVGINASADTASILHVGGSATVLAGTTEFGLSSTPIFAVGATTAEYGIEISTTGAAALHTTTTVAGLHVSDHTKGASQTVTNNYGIFVDDRTKGTTTLVAGIRLDLTVLSGRWNVYAAGSAANAFAGSVRIGSVVAPTVALDVTGAALISTTLGVTGTLTASGNLVVNGNTTIGDSTTDTFTVSVNTVTWSGNPTHSGNHIFSGNVTHNGNTVLGDSTTDTLTIASNAVTWSGNPTHSGNHTWSGDMTINGNVSLGDSTADTLTIAPTAVTWGTTTTHSGNHSFSGILGINSGINTGASLAVGGSSALGGGSQRGISVSLTFGVGSTASEFGISIATTGNAGLHTTTDVGGLTVADHTKGASQTVTNSYGVLVNDRTAAATLIAGVRSNVSSGTGKWNWYSAGTADSSFNGNVRIGSNVAPTVALDVTGSIIGSVNFTAWTAWTPTRTGWTDVGSPTVTARYCQIRNLIFFQIKVVPATTTATVAGTSYTDLPVAAGASGLAGTGVMGNDTTRVSIGNGEFDIANSRFYVPTQGATANTLQLSGWYEV